MASKLKFDEHGSRFSSMIFRVFFVVSVLTIVYFNLISTEELKLVSIQFPEYNADKKRAIVDNYRIMISAALFLVDVVIVGPFAYLHYFGDHIKPRRFNQLVAKVGFFDLGLGLALVFTIMLASAHILIINTVSDIRLSCTEKWIILGFNAFIGFVWLAIAIMKIYTYSPEQRKQLSKYLIKL